ncbi:V-type ATP synthase subunit D [candidate division KSB1 bacterium]|nr:V-type ATP synthase subunit D [candidate division KSB1 bacterium]
MAIKFQYNKTSLQSLEKQLKIRVNALPTLKNKEAALRVEVKIARKKTEEVDELIKTKLSRLEDSAKLWSEYDQGLVKIQDLILDVKKIAGVKTPVLKDISFVLSEFSMFNAPLWFMDGISIVKDLKEIVVKREIFARKMALLDYARKKTTQKVNLYEKVQIPEYQSAIRKIKGFLEDEENLSKASQKIVKNRQLKMEEAF